MLFIESKGDNAKGGWHVGDAVPNLHGPVITFQADGHELEALLLGMRHAYVDERGRTQLRKVNFDE